MKRAGRGLIQVTSDFGAGEFTLLRAAAELAQRPTVAAAGSDGDRSPSLERNAAVGRQSVCRRARLYGAGKIAPDRNRVGSAASRHPFLTHSLWHSREALDHNARIARIVNDGELRR